MAALYMLVNRSNYFLLSPCDKQLAGFAWALGWIQERAEAPQAIQHISFPTDNTTTTTKSEDGHYARTDYAGTVPIT